MDRKATARETLNIMEKGFYEAGGERIDISSQQEYSVKNSFLLTPEEGRKIADVYRGRDVKSSFTCAVMNCSTVDAVLKLTEEGKKKIGVLNFASAKNPGGGFINGAMAQEESLAASSGLYGTLIVHEDYYKKNRACGTMMYTDHAIYSPEVVFFRDGSFRLLKEPVTASVLTLPAVNMGQVLLRGEDKEQAERVMHDRMKLALAVFARQNCRHLILGAYGCGVFRNDPEKVAAWWKELSEGFFPDSFETITHAVLDRSKTQSVIKPFLRIFGTGGISV